MFSFKIIPLGERILFDAAALLDVMALSGAEDSVDLSPSNVDHSTDFSPVLVEHGEKIDSGERLLVVSSEIEDAHDLLNTVLEGVHTLVYDAAILSPLLLAAEIGLYLKGKKIDHLAILNGSRPSGFALTSGKIIDQKKLSDDVELQQFLHELSQHMSPKATIDLLTCNTKAFMGSSRELEIIAMIQKLQEESNDKQPGAYEVTGVNISRLYFDQKKLTNWNEGHIFFSKSPIEELAEKSRAYTMGVFALANEDMSPEEEPPAREEDVVTDYFTLIRKAFENESHS